jgi:2-polyprenyl-3-methyl-5-hydroxy-6-metoxy-1,4-benzoquinol methylase
VAIIRREKIRRKMELGWHYLLDLAWTVGEVGKLPKGATILDAGAGGGLLQYILVELGYRVISVDFAPRAKPLGIESIKVSQEGEFNHEYIEHLKMNYASARRATNKPVVVNSRKKFLEMLDRQSAPLVFYQADLLNMSLLPNGFVDAVVSVSALEHINREQVGGAVDECLRVLKRGCSILATTSAAEEKDWYHEPSKGWCYSESSLRQIFQLLPSVSSNFEDYQQIMKDLRRPGNELHVQLAPFYFLSQNNGMPWGVWNPEYLPVGIKKIKQKQK